MFKGFDLMQEKSQSCGGFEVFCCCRISAEELSFRTTDSTSTLHSFTVSQLLIQRPEKLFQSVHEPQQFLSNTVTEFTVIYVIQYLHNYIRQTPLLYWYLREHFVLSSLTVTITFDFQFSLFIIKVTVRRIC